MPVSNRSPSRTAPVIPAPGGNSRMTASAVMDFPDPEAPTRPRISPGDTLSDTSSRIRLEPIDTHSDSMVRSGVIDPRPRAARNPSPRRFRPSTSSTTANPGNNASEGASAVSDCASLSMRPQLGVGGCAPSPTYERPASAMTPSEN